MTLVQESDGATLFETWLMEQRGLSRTTARTLARRATEHTWTCNVCWERETASANPMDDLRAERDRLYAAAMKVLSHFRDSQYGGGYAPLSAQVDVDADVRGLQNALESGYWTTGIPG